MENLEKFCEKFLAIRGTRRFDSEINFIKDSLNENKSKLTDEDYQWFSNALLDENQKWFVVFVFNYVIGNIPKKLYSSMIKAAVYETNPSFNRSFVESCINSFGYRKVNEDLLEFVKNGSNFEKTGAVNALYWAQVPLSWVGQTEHSLENATPESREVYESMIDVIQYKSELFLEEFVTNENLDVRRGLIPSLVLHEEYYPPQLKPLVKRVIEIARSSSDDYIRHRVEVQLGNESLITPLPHRK